ncbi:hypothetical protein PYCC9005_001655 [Savitreella phatthalungensis]
MALIYNYPLNLNRKTPYSRGSSRPVSRRSSSDDHRPCSATSGAETLHSGRERRLARGHLPVEILTQIVHFVGAQAGVYSRLASLRRLRQTCRQLNSIVLPLLYRQIVFNGPHAFAKFMHELQQHPERGLWIRTLDFSAFTSVGLGRSLMSHGKFTFLTSESLAACLELCPNVEELFVSEALETDIDLRVLQTAFGRLSRLRAIDFCAATSAEFCAAMSAFSASYAPLLARSAPISGSLNNLSLHNCSQLSSEFFEELLPRLPQLKRLDLAATKVSWTALSKISRTARLEELNLAHCGGLDGLQLMNFIAQHPAASTLKRLNLLQSWNKIHPLAIDEEFVTGFLDVLPPQLQSLDLGGLELCIEQLARMPVNLFEFGCHDIHLSQTLSRQLGTTAPTVLQNLEFLSMTINVIGDQSGFARALCSIFPKLAVIECPGLALLHRQMPELFGRIEGQGRRAWLRHKYRSCDNVEGEQDAWHARKSNMSLSRGAPRGLYNYYAYRVR